MGRNARLRMVGGGGLVRPDGKPASAHGKVSLGYPYGGSVTGPFHLSVLALVLFEMTREARGVGEPLLHIGGHGPVSGLYVEDNRQRITEAFMADPAKPEWLLQIDTDISFPPTIIETLLRVAGSTKKVLAASVPLGPPFPGCALRATQTPGIWAYLNSEEITADGVEVDGLATAVILIHRDVIEAIADRDGQCWFLRKPTARLDQDASRAAWLGQGPSRDRRYINQGEDLAFCLRAKEAGFGIWCAKVPGLRHHKTLPMSHDHEAAEPSPATEAAPAAMEA